jgi:phospholipid/cholesterol/gamma-HCH transport system substrate-binding protein
MIEDSRGFELKVGIFILIGLLILLIIVFSIGDVYFFKGGYEIYVVFNFANGIEPGSPVRVAGYQVGEIDNIKIYFDEEENRTKVRLKVWIEEGVSIEKDAEAVINTLGLLGEKYLEIFPGQDRSAFIKPGDTITGTDPVSMEKMTHEMKALLSEVKVIISKVKAGTGTVGRLINEDKLYEDLEATVADLRAIVSDTKKGKGLMGRVLTDETIYNDLEEFVADIKAHPWKLFHKPSGTQDDDAGREKRERRPKSNISVGP